MAIDAMELAKTRRDPETEEEAVRNVPIDEEQVELVTRLAVKMLKEGGGLDTLKRALDTSQDPAQVTGQFLVQLIAALAEELSKQIDLDPRIFLAQGGFLDHILDYIEQQLSLPAEFSDEVRGECLEMIRALAQGEKKPGGQQAGPAQGGPPPQAGPAPGGPPQAGGLDQMGMGG